MSRTSKSVPALRSTSVVTIADLADALARAEATVAGAQDAHVQAEAAYSASLLSPDANVTAAASLDRDRARINLDRTNAQLTAARDRLERGQDAEAETIRRDAYKAAETARMALIERLQRDYPAAAATIANLIADLVVFDGLLDAVNRDLPVGAEPLASPEAAVRDIPEIPRKVIHEAEADMWVSTFTGSVLPPHLQARVGSAGGGEGFLPPDSSISTTANKVVRRPVRQTQFHPAIAAQFSEPLASAVRLPGLTATDDPFFPASQSAPRSPRPIEIEHEVLPQPVNRKVAA